MFQINPEMIKVFESIEPKQDIWFDRFERIEREGISHIFKAIDRISGEWLFEVRECPDEISVRVLVRPTGRPFHLLDLKSIVFGKCKEGNKFYHPLHIGGAMKDYRVESTSELPRILEPIFEKFYRTEIYESVTDKGNKLLRGKLVVVLNQKDYENMVRLFIIERVWPLLEEEKFKLAESEAGEREKEEKAELIIKCKCSVMVPFGWDKCPNCGAQFDKYSLLAS